MNPFCPIPTAIKKLKNGKMLIVVDNPGRENQGDLIFPAEVVTDKKVNFLLQRCRGMICVAITKAKVRRLDLPLMVPPIGNTEKTNVQFTVTVDARSVKSFGISAADRAMTIKILADSSSKPTDLVRPGHVFPLLARDGGVRERAGHTEATVELVRLSGFSPCGVLCEILKEDGEVAKLPELTDFAKRFNINIVSIKDLIKYLKNRPHFNFNSLTVIKTASALLPTEHGTFHITVYKSIYDQKEHIALRMGNTKGKPVLTRIHSQCITGDTFLSCKCDCRDQLHQSLKRIGQKGDGILIYLNQEGRGIGLTNKIKAYALQEKGLDTVEANEALGLPIDARDYKIAAEILQDQGIFTITLLTNNPTKVQQLSQLGIDVTKQIPLEGFSHEMNKGYLKVKKYKLGHTITSV